ncbi:MAG: hypothetical protein EOP87_23020 [Verrucomicrobiaceae bacterium]|nr:MAG: hypothetical protein EOP87_23020 [Verrucomicrobiaceae bacterium]
MMRHLLLLVLPLALAGCAFMPDRITGREVHISTVKNPQNGRTGSRLGLGVHYTDLMFDRRYSDQYEAYLQGKGPVYVNPQFWDSSLRGRPVFRGTITLDEQKKTARIDMHQVPGKDGKLVETSASHVTGTYPITVWTHRLKNPTYDDDP